MPTPQPKKLGDNDLVTGAARLPAFIKRYGAFVLLGLAIGVLAYEILHMRAQRQKQALASGWMQYYTSNTPSDFQNNVIALYHDPALDAFAYDRIGDFYLLAIDAGKPIMNVKTTRKEAIAGARHAFHTVLRKYAKQTLAANLARIGMGILDEDCGQWDKAAAIYKQLTANGGALGGPWFAHVAAYRLRHLAQWKRRPLLARSSDSSILHLPHFNSGGFGPAFPPAPSGTGAAGTTNGLTAPETLPGMNPGLVHKPQAAPAPAHKPAAAPHTAPSPAQTAPSQPKKPANQ